MLCTHDSFYLWNTGYPCQVRNNFQLARRQEAVLQAQVILQSLVSARLTFFTLFTAISSSCLHGFSLSTQMHVWKVLVKKSLEIGTVEASEFGTSVPTHCPLDFLKCCHGHLSLRQRESFWESRYYLHFIA